MDRIVIEVDDTTAKQWRITSQKRKKEISQIIEIKIAKELMTDSKDDFKVFLDDLRVKMKNRGLTEEILEEILKDE